MRTLVRGAFNMRVAFFALTVLAVLGLAAAPGLGRVGKVAPNFAGGGPWFNTDGKPLTIQELQGKVVAVEMWTAGCYNCRNVIPSLKDWYARYRDQGFTIVAVHAPEFSYERSERYVRESVGKLGIKYPVVMDNNFRIWRAYNNVYWPTLYLVDKKGVIRYQHIGEGAYDETDRVIRQLLKEA
jgi:thiol-disulfide isomerase/thioredoxin